MACPLTRVSTVASVFFSIPMGPYQLEAAERHRRFLNRAAFAVPAAGTYGDYEARSVTGPGFRGVDRAIARLLRPDDRRTFEIRVETSNLFNNSAGGDPVTHVDSPQFGRITTQNGNPRIMQSALKYGF